MIIATAGHVDHGKTLLVKALTGVDTDRLPEEKARGLTIELGFAYRDLGDGEVAGFIDVPGHERFIRTMVAGVSGIDVVLFVIAADDGPMPQTEEHLAILDLLGVDHGVVALTKTDRVDAARVAEVSERIAALVADTRLAGMPVKPVSAMTGEGIDALREALLAARREVDAREEGGNFRLAVDRSFVLKGAGRVVTGTVFSGRVAVGEAVHVVPAGGELRVRGIHAQNAEAEAARAGQRCALNVAGGMLRQHEIRRGEWITGRGAAFATKRFDARISVLPSESRGLRNRTPVHVHVGAADVTGRIVTLDGKTIAPGESALAHVLLDRELGAVRGDRAILRDQSARRTLGGAEVLDPLPVVRGRTRAQRNAHLRAMAEPDARASLARALAGVEGGVDLGRFAHAWNLNDEEARSLWATVPMQRVDTAAGPVGLDPAQWAGFAPALAEALAAHHRDQPQSLGAGEAVMLKALPARMLPGVADAALDALVAAGEAVRDGGLLRAPKHEARRSPEDEALWQRVRPLLDAPDFKVPVVHDMLDRLRMNHAALETFLVRAAGQGYVVKVSAKRYFLPETVATLAGFVRELAGANPDGVFSVADYRDRAGIGRNAVIEILEYFDRVGFTRRHGQVRIILNDAAV